MEQLGLGKHNLNTDQLNVYLSNAAPSQSLDTALADLAQIANGNGYTTDGIDVQNAWAETGGTATLTAAADPSWTASGAAMAQFQYVVLMNVTQVTAPVKPLIAYWDYGSPIDLQVGESFTVTIGASLFTLA